MKALSIRMLPSLMTLVAAIAMSVGPASAQSLQSTVSYSGQQIIDNSPTNNFAAGVVDPVMGTLTPSATLPLALDEGFASTQLGSNHAYASSLLSGTSSFPVVQVTSTYSDVINFTLNQSIPNLGTILSGSSVEFTFTGDGVTSGDSAYNNADYFVSSAVNNDAYYGSPVSDEFFLSSGTNTYVSDPFDLVNGQFTGSFELSAQAFGGVTDFSDTVDLTGITLYDANFNVISQADYTVSSESGTTYPLGGTAPAPEATSITIFFVLICVLGIYLRSGRKKKLPAA